MTVSNIEKVASALERKMMPEARLVSFCHTQKEEIYICHK